MKDFKIPFSSFLQRWFMGTSIAIIGLALCMWLWLRPQWEQETESWQPVNDEIAQLLGPLEGTESNEANKSAPNRTKTDKAAASSSSSPSAKSALNGSEQSAEPPSSSGASDVMDKEPHANPSRAAAQSDQSTSGAGASNSTQQTDIRASEPPAANRSSSANLININQADANLLTELPGIGPSKAKAIIAYREQHGAFNKVNDITKVKGIGPKMFAKLRDKISVE
ncbi:ComEA family DNA-binding protein [Paenibacillus profundus]|uniref:ComEA family DNA-binding protein n=1 Tax=Paenibacillus profundus TaxID=1173085 RepID=A0ABS8Y8T7_9BACL|nr:ComEA family DNA-binding protein [Paenibacillus profundus]MCE5167731.1 ComEA family DNA-binding protein [Paenibacillus profundus]